MNYKMLMAATLAAMYPPLPREKLSFNQALHLVNVEHTAADKLTFIKSLRERDMITEDTETELNLEVKLEDE